MAVSSNLETLVKLALAEDFGDAGDVTSDATLSPEQIITGRIISKADGVIAGLEAVQQVYATVDPAVKMVQHIQDGTTVSPGTLVAAISGPAIAVLSGERTALNFLQRLSGIATLTAKYVAAVAGTGATILDTRKTTPGWRVLEKHAVCMGGGTNHRMGLYDAVLIKDNHIDAAGSITAAVQAVLARSPQLPVIVEVKDFDELRETLPLGITRILLDNMTPVQMAQAVQITDGHVPLEASGNVNLETVREIAETGVDYISVGALTHSAPAFDVSMRL